jgi:hypothetical protein
MIVLLLDIVVESTKKQHNNCGKNKQIHLEKAYGT